MIGYKDGNQPSPKIDKCLYNISKSKSNRVYKSCEYGKQKLFMICHQNLIIKMTIKKHLNKTTSDNVSDLIHKH